MVIILIFQYINNDWRHLGNAQIASKALAMKYIDELEEKLSDPNVTNVPLRENTHDLMVLNLTNGPVKFKITE